MRIKTKNLWKASPILALLPIATLTQAQTAFPTKPIRMITEFVAGSGGDTLLRIVAEGLGPVLGQAVVIENRAGAGGVVAAEAVARSAPDGYTLFGATPNTQTIRPHLARVNTLDPIKDFTPITSLAEPTIVIVANPAFPANNLKELIDYARANPGKLSYATSGIGSSHHLSGEQIQILTSVKFTHVPYKALAESLRDVVSGQIPVGFNLNGPVAPMAKAGKVKLIAIVNERRSTEWPDVGIVSESVPGFEKPSSWTGLLGPGAMAPALARRIASDVVKTMNEPKTKARIEGAGFTVRGNTPEEFFAQLRRETELVGRIVKTAGIQPTE
ncbi:MAG: Bug family tripartite tricarboxylate transporter substrate binding protein [Burkholderiales bacterium]